MWIICFADDSHKMSRLIFFEYKKKEKKEKNKNMSAAVVIGTLKVNIKTEINAFC